MSISDAILDPNPVAKNILDQNIQRKKPSLIGRCVKWLKASDESKGTQLTRRVLAIFLAGVLSLTIIGIIPVVLAAREWKKQNKIEKPKPIIHGEIRNQTLVSANPIQANAEYKFEDLADASFKKIPDAEILAKQDRIVNTNPKYKKVNLSELQKEELLPINLFEMGDVKYYCSNVINFEGHHRFVFALVEINGELTSRIFYHSNSQASWRVMPFAMKIKNFLDAKNPPKLAHFGKGQCESDTQLPTGLMIALNKLPLHPKSVQYPLHEVIKTQKGNDSFMKAVNVGESMFLQAGADKAFYNAGMIVPRCPDPHQVKMPKDENLHPDFSKCVELNQEFPDTYGKVKTKIFESKNKELIYTFYEADDGRAYLANVECVNAKINTFGVRDKVISTDNMDAPLLVYHCQVPQEYAPEAYRGKWYNSTKYSSNWNYVRELEIIKMYYAAQSRAIPEKV